MKNKIGSIINAVMGIVLAIGPFSLFKPCRIEELMKCTYSGRIISMIGVLIFIVSLIGLLVADENKKCINLIMISMFVCSILVPKVLIGGCEKMNMRCNSITFPFVYIIAAIGIIANSSLLIFGTRGKRK